MHAMAECEKLQACAGDGGLLVRADEILYRQPTDAGEMEEAEQCSMAMTPATTSECGVGGRSKPRKVRGHGPVRVCGG
jgi:hypothetical protein